MAQLKINLLGEFQFWRDSVPVPSTSWNTSKGRELLAMLAVHQGQFCSSRQLCKALWPDVDVEKSANNLRGRVAEARRALEPGLAQGRRSRYIVSSLGGYRLAHVPDLDVDLMRFHAAIKRGDEAAEKQRWSQAIQAFQTASSLYKSDFLPEYALAEWTQSLQRHCLEKLHVLLVSLAQCHEHLDRYDRALLCWKRAFEQLPSDEQGALSLMRCQLLLGERQGALNTFERCAQRLVALGVEPCGELLAINERVKQSQLPKDTTRHRAWFDARSHLPPGLARPPFVGRLQQLSVLIRSVATAFEHGGYGVFVVGDPGIGKTRLFEEFLEQLPLYHHNVLVLRGQGIQLDYPSRYHTLATTFLPLVSTLGQAFFEQLPSSLREQLEVLWPALTAEKRLSRAVHHSQTALLQGLIAMARAAIEAGYKLVLMVEDVQWVEPQSLDAIRQFVLATEGWPLFVAFNGERAVGTLVRSPLDETKWQTRSEFIDLEALSFEHVEHVLRALSFGSVSVEQVELLYRECLGNPLYLTALVKNLFDENVLQLDADGRWQNKKSLATIDWPPAMQATISRELDALDEPVRRAVTAASALGTNFSAGVLQGVLDVSEERTFSALDSLIALHFVEATKTGFQFVYPKVRDVIYAGLGEMERRLLHKKAARTLTKRVEGNTVPVQVKLAYHYEKARLWACAYDHAKRALSQALECYYVEEASALLKQVDYLLQKCDFNVEQQQEENCILQLHKAKLLELTGDRREQQHVLDLLSDTFESLDVPHLEAHYHDHLATFYVLSGKHEKAVQAARQSLSDWERCQNEEGFATSLQRLGRVHWHGGDYERALTCYLGAYRSLQRQDNAHEAAYALDNAGVAARSLGRLLEARDYHRQALGVFERYKDDFGKGVCYNNLASWHNEAYQPQATIKWARAAFAFHHRVGNVRGQGLAFQNMARAFSLEQKHRHAGRLLRLAERHYRHIDDQPRQTLVHHDRGLNEHRAGHSRAALLQFKRAAQRARTLGMLDRLCLAQSWQARMLLALGDAPAALQHSQDALALLKQGFLIRPHLVHLHHAQALLYTEGDARAVRIHVVAAYEQLMQRVGSLPHKKLGQRYVEKEASHRLIVVAYERGNDALKGATL